MHPVDLFLLTEELSGRKILRSKDREDLYIMFLSEHFRFLTINKVYINNNSFIICVRKYVAKYMENLFKTHTNTVGVIDKHGYSQVQIIDTPENLVTQLIKIEEFFKKANKDLRYV